MTQQFVDQFVKTGVYHHELDVELNSAFKNVGLHDKDHHYHPFGAEEFVMVYDKTKACPAGIPDTWRKFCMTVLKE